MLNGGNRFIPTEQTVSAKGRNGSMGAIDVAAVVGSANLSEPALSPCCLKPTTSPKFRDVACRSCIIALANNKAPQSYILPSM